MIFEAPLDYHVNTMVFILAISHGIIIMVYIMVCDAGRTTVLFIVMECKLNAVLAFASEKKTPNKQICYSQKVTFSIISETRSSDNKYVPLTITFPCILAVSIKFFSFIWFIRCDGCVCQRRCLGWFRPVRFFFLSTLLSAPRLNCLYSHSPSAVLDPSSRR